MAERMIKASEFKAKCLKLMDEIKESGDVLVITKKGEPVAELRPPRHKRRSLWGLHAGQIKIHGDIVGPAFDEKDWALLTGKGEEPSR
jgi:antitoxin (DNA-binding transcriptional repressor) of toxin-antitoxin stability system